MDWQQSRLEEGGKTTVFTHDAKICGSLLQWTKPLPDWSSKLKAQSLKYRCQMKIHKTRIYTQDYSSTYMPIIPLTYLFIRSWKCKSVSKRERYRIIVNIKNTAGEEYDGSNKNFLKGVTSNHNRVTLYSRRHSVAHLSFRPPVFLAMGIEPYLMAIIWKNLQRIFWVSKFTRN